MCEVVGVFTICGCAPLMLPSPFGGSSQPIWCFYSHTEISHWVSRLGPMPMSIPKIPLRCVLSAFFMARIGHSHASGHAVCLIKYLQGSLYTAPSLSPSLPLSLRSSRVLPLPILTFINIPQFVFVALTQRWWTKVPRVCVSLCVCENICRPLYAGVSCTLIALFVVLGWQWPLERALQVCFD